MELVRFVFVLISEHGLFGFNGFYSFVSEFLSVPSVISVFVLISEHGLHELHE